jgi:hypothetical protein
MVQVSCAAEWFREHLLYPGAGIGDPSCDPQRIRRDQLRHCELSHNQQRS